MGRAFVNDVTTSSEYETWHAEREAAFDEHDIGAPWHLATLRHLPDIAGKRVLEIGCGRGVFARELVEFGARVAAADFSPAAVALAEERLNGRAETLVADIQEIPFDDEHFEVVISQETVEHVPDPKRALAELVRVTERGGTLILTGPNYLNMIGLYRVALRLVGRRYTEGGQPINQPLLFPVQARRLRRLGCRLEVVEGQGVPLVVPKVGTWHLPARPQWLMRWFGHQTIIVATRL
jgi:2-polyprenyl-3-methyl-5-hydroxy-6-metoxy-1,4-benzoquinol methylase